MEKPIIYNRNSAPHFTTKKSSQGICSIHLYANGRIRFSSELIKIAKLEKGLVFFADGVHQADFYIASESSSLAFRLSKPDRRGATIESSTLVGLICGAAGVQPPVKFQVATVPTAFPGISGHALDMRHPHQLKFAENIPHKE